MRSSGGHGSFETPSATGVFFHVLTFLEFIDYQIQVDCQSISDMLFLIFTRYNYIYLVVNAVVEGIKLLI